MAVAVKRRNNETRNSRTGYEIAVLAAVVFIFIIGNMSAQKDVSVKFLNRNAVITAEIADIPYMQGKGLMFRQNMSLDSGMLFIFNEPKELKFWMKNTLMPLDIIFISENMTITNIAENAQPCTTNCEIYSSAAPAEYAIEVNAGFARMNGIKAGDMVRIG